MPDRTRPLVVVVVTCALALLVACDPQDPAPPPSALEGTCWRLAEIHHSVLAYVRYPDPDVPACRLELCFEFDGRYRAGGCNACSGTFERYPGFVDEVIELRSRLCTERGCVPACSPGETEVLDVPTFVERRGERLVLDSQRADGHEIYVFDPL